VPKTRRLSDATLVRRSQQGDRRAFSALLSRYDWRLRGLAHALLLDTAEMDAALGIGYLRAWRDVVRVNTKDDVAAWLYRVTYNACIDQLRRADGPTARAPVAAPADAADGGIAAGLARLPAAERVAVVLVDREGFSTGSAARILGLAPAALATTLEAAREHLTPYLPPPGATPTTTTTADSDPEPDADVDPGPEPEVAVDAQPEVGPDVEPERDVEPEPEPEPQVEPAVEPEPEPQRAEAATAVAAADVGATADVVSGNGAGANGHTPTHTAGNGTADTDSAGNGNRNGSAETADDTATVAGNGEGDNRGRGRRARRRAKHTAVQRSTDRPDPSGDNAP
jgi:DNA-directed RNA polymerase specialized sigma24 family protein